MSDDPADAAEPSPAVETADETVDDERADEVDLGASDSVGASGANGADASDASDAGTSDAADAEDGDGTVGDGPTEGDGDDGAGTDGEAVDGDDPLPGVPEDVQRYERFTKMDGAQYERVNDFLRDRTYITAREWAIARLCADFRTETGVEMTKIGENLPELVPFMTDTYTPQAVNQARASFEEKVQTAGATFLYGAMCDFFTAEELDDLMYEATEVAKFLLEVEGVDLAVDEELAAEDRISSVMRDVRTASESLRHDHAECPNCGHDLADD